MLNSVVGDRKKKREGKESNLECKTEPTRELLLFRSLSEVRVGICQRLTSLDLSLSLSLSYLSCFSSVLFLLCTQCVQVSWSLGSRNCQTNVSRCQMSEESKKLLLRIRKRTIPALQSMISEEISKVRVTSEERKKNVTHTNFTLVSIHSSYFISLMVRAR